MRIAFLFVLLFSISQFYSYTANGQNYYRITADFTVKVKKSDGGLNLTKGKVFYDKNYKELIYDITFPQPERWIIKDTLLMKVRKDTVFAKTKIPSINEFTVFHLALNSSLTDFGLKNSIYKMNKVEKMQDLTLSYWKIPNQEDLNFVVVAKKDNKLESVIMFGHQSNIISKQFFKNYAQFNAFEFPQQIVQVLTDESGGENYQVTEFANIKVNDLENSNSYRTKF